MPAQFPSRTSLLPSLEVNGLSCALRLIPFVRPFSHFFELRFQQKTPVSEPDRIPGRAMNVVLPPGFACPSRDKPHRVPPYSGAITGAPVRSLLLATVSIGFRSNLRLRGHVRLSAPPRFHLIGFSVRHQPAYSSRHCLYNHSICLQVSHTCSLLSTRTIATIKCAETYLFLSQISKSALVQAHYYLTTMLTRRPGT